MSRRNVFVIVFASLVLWMLILGGAALVSAQEATEAAPVIVTPEPEQPPVVVVETPSLSDRIVTFLTGAVAGAVAAGGAILAAVRSVKANPAWELAIERLWESQPVETKQRLRPIVEGAHEIIHEVDRLTDGQPNVPLAPPESSGAG